MTTTPATGESLRAALAEHFRFSAFLPGQEDVLRRVLDGRDTLALMPTGSGKSLPYQLAAMLLRAPTLVVSPLIALMKDQVDKLPRGVAERAAFVNSSLPPDEAAARLAAFANGTVKLLYAAPERFRQRGFVAALARARVGLVVVDEIHCVSMWGHDFRPDYFFIRSVLEELGRPTVLGLTATATPTTEREVGEALGRRFDIVRASVVRQNLHHEVDIVEDEEARRRRLLERLRAAAGPAIVYARSRKKCEELSRLLRDHAVRAVHYHAGLPADERTAVQDAFLAGERRVVVATTAFGMGIDKPDIRLVLLYNYPASLEDYVQMVGRAGRDGRDSACVLFAGNRDAAALKRFAEADVPPAEVLIGLYEDVVRRAPDGSTRAFPDELPAGDHDPRVLVGMLEQLGLVNRGFDAGGAFDIAVSDARGRADERIRPLVARLRREAAARARQIVAYGDSARCRQQQIAEHFGEVLAVPCGACDQCAGVSAAAPSAPARRPVPTDVAGAILDAVAGLRWPLGRAGLAAMLTGSVSAPPSARRNPAFGVLAAVSPGTVKRWLQLLELSGHLEPYESDDGFRLLRLVRRDDPPALRLAGSPPAGADGSAPVDDALIARLKAWRVEPAPADELPPFDVFSDRTLHALAAARPRDPSELASVPGIGPAKLDRYGDALMRVFTAEATANVASAR